MAEGDTNLSETIKQTAQGPSLVEIDGNRAVAQDPTKQIEADRHLAATQGVARRHRGVRSTKLAAPGSVY